MPSTSKYRSRSGRWVWIVTVCVLLLLGAAVLPEPSPAGGDDASGPDGPVFSEDAVQPNTGFGVRDEGRDDTGQLIRFASEFQRLGGAAELGYPISRAYRDADGFYYQLFQRALLQWRPERDGAVLANLLDSMSDAGADTWLSSKGIPPAIKATGNVSDFTSTLATRLNWLSEPHISNAYLAAAVDGGLSHAAERYGLPMSLPVRAGPFVVQRFQRVALQVWLDDAPGMPAPGTVVPALVGDLYRRYQLDHGHSAADQRFIPETLALGATTSAVSTTAPAGGLRASLDLLAANPEGAKLATALRTPGVQVVFEEVPGIAEFLPWAMTIAISPTYRNADPRALASVLAHEASHLLDFLNKVDIYTAAGCTRSEYVAYGNEANVWRAFYGPSGKVQPVTDLDSELNNILDQVTNNAQGFAKIIADAYKSQCGG